VISDWDISKGRTGYHLHHQDEPCQRTMEVQGTRKPDSYFIYGWACYKKNGYWVCGRCGAVAPDEVDFLATLADCPKTHNEFVNKVEKHERLVKQRLL
jgi:hypothetical protein